jgi:peroxiredoxin
MTLNTELAALRSCMMARVGADQADVVKAVEQQMLAADYGRTAPHLGDIAPDFTLPDQMGRAVNLYEALRRGPVILSFYRGGWSPFCMLTLRALQREVTAAARIPATIMAISPQDQTTTAATAETHGVTFPLLSDYKAGVGHAWSLVYDLPEGLRPLYERLGHSLAKLNGCGTWAVPVTAGYVIGTDRRVAYAHLDPRPQVRMDPPEAMAIARKLAALQLVAD